MSMLALFVLSMLRWQKKNERLSFSFYSEGFKRFGQFRIYLPFVLITLHFAIVFFSLWQTTQYYGYFLERLRIKLPFLILPVAFLGLPRFNKSELNFILYFLLIFMTLNSIGIGIYYLMHFEEVQRGLSLGHPFPTPRNHIRYSLLTAISILGGLHLTAQKYYWKYPQERRLIIALTVFVFLFIHLLSVKSGILSLYFALVCALLRYIYCTQKYLIGIGILLGLMMIPYIIYQSVPSFHNKIDYMMMDLKQYQKGQGGNYADAGRLTSIKVGYELWQSAPLMGVGAGNFRRAVNEVYASKYPDYIQPIMPHNQFLFVLAGTGLFGLFLFMIAFWVPLFFRKAYRHFFFFAFYMLFFCALVLEHSIENAEGVGIFVFFLLLLLNHLHLRHGADY